MSILMLFDQFYTSYLNAWMRNHNTYSYWAKIVNHLIIKPPNRRAVTGIPEQLFPPSTSGLSYTHSRTPVSWCLRYSYCPPAAAAFLGHANHPGSHIQMDGNQLYFTRNANISFHIHGGEIILLVIRLFWNCFLASKCVEALRGLP